MTKLRVIDGTKKEKPSYTSLYCKAFINVVKNIPNNRPNFEDYDLDTRKKLIFLGVKWINGTKVSDDCSNKDLLEGRFSLILQIKNIAGTLTPREFQTIFPIAKYYYGERYEMKDYFHTKKYIEEFGVDKVIGDKITEFFWEYMNKDTRQFEVQFMSVASKVRRIEGGMGFMEEFLSEQGVAFHTMYEGYNGEKFLLDNINGKARRIRRTIPRHLKVIK